jgi:hypothetical protein
MNQRAEYIERLQQLCRDLNEAGDSVRWTPSQLHMWINARFDVTDGVDALAFESFPQTISELQGRLDSLRTPAEGRL